eukprot:Rmarinus@m.25978
MLPGTVFFSGCQPDATAGLTNEACVPPLVDPADYTVSMDLPLDDDLGYQAASRVDPDEARKRRRQRDACQNKRMKLSEPPSSPSATEESPLSLGNLESCSMSEKQKFLSELVSGNLIKRRRKNPCNDEDLWKLIESCPGKEANQLKRILKNRESARSHRQKKQSELKASQDQVEVLRQQLNIAKSMITELQQQLVAKDAENASLRLSLAGAPAPGVTAPAPVPAPALAVQAPAPVLAPNVPGVPSGSPLQSIYASFSAVAPSAYSQAATVTTDVQQTALDVPTDIVRSASPDANSDTLVGHLDGGVDIDLPLDLLPPEFVDPFYCDHL